MHGDLLNSQMWAIWRGHTIIVWGITLKVNPLQKAHRVETGVAPQCFAGLNASAGRIGQGDDVTPLVSMWCQLDSGDQGKAT